MNINLLKILFASIIISLFPNFVWASGGGPLLLIFNSSIFIVGQIWIMGIEFIIYRRLVMASRQEIFGDIFSANIFSTIAVAFGFPILVAAVGLIGNFLYGAIGEVLLALGTWVYKNSNYSRLAVQITLFWFAVSFVITLYFEAWILKKRWEKRNFAPGMKPTTLCWYTNTISHIGLLLAILVIWHELI
jgi:hypothetical protein